MQYPDGSLVNRAYTNRGQLQAVNYMPLAGASSSVATFTYDAGERETQRNLGNGLTTTRSYFADNQIQSIATPTVETLTYTYDSSKNPTSETRSGVMDPYSWTTGPTGYDDEDRLTTWSRTNGDSQTWNLSPVHDWNSTTINGAVQTRTHGPAHELLAMSGAQVTNSPRPLTNDTKGNMTTDARGCSMSWDFDNMLQSFAANGLSGQSDITFDYDVLGRRIQRQEVNPEASTTVRFIHAHHQEIWETTSSSNGSDKNTAFVFGEFIDEPVVSANGENAGVSLSWYFQNYQSSTYAIANGDGYVTLRFSYNVFGESVTHQATGEIYTTPQNDGRFLYTGRRTDVASNLQYFRSRYFRSDAGRFLTRDAERYIDGLSQYAAYFTPKGVDPFGEDWHHRLPWEFMEYWDRWKVPFNNPEFGCDIDPADHRLLHGEGYNDEWRKFIEKHKPPKKKPTIDEIKTEMKRIEGLKRFRGPLKNSREVICKYPREYFRRNPAEAKKCFGKGKKGIAMVAFVYLLLDGTDVNAVMPFQCNDEMDDLNKKFGDFAGERSKWNCHGAAFAFNSFLECMGQDSTVNGMLLRKQLADCEGLP